MAIGPVRRCSSGTAPRASKPTARRSTSRPDDDPRTRVGRLGLAQRQMVEIAKALAVADDAAAATVLVMDEPTSALTTREVEQLFSLIRRLSARGVAIVYITHRMDEVFRIGERV